MTSGIELTPEARRHLNQLPEKVRDVAIALMLGTLSDNPRRAGKQLVGELEGLWSARRRDFRVVYEIDDAANIVIVLRVHHRGDVYRSRSPAAVSTLTGVRGSKPVSSGAHRQPTRVGDDESAEASSAR